MVDLQNVHVKSRKSGYKEMGPAMGTFIASDFMVHDELMCREGRLVARSLAGFMTCKVLHGCHGGMVRNVTYKCLDEASLISLSGCGTIVYKLVELQYPPSYVLSTIQKDVVQWYFFFVTTASEGLCGCPLIIGGLC